MRRRLLLLAVLAVIPVSAGAQSRMRIVAGPVTATGGTVSGSFRVRESRRAGIVSLGTGGACLVAERSDRGCTVDQECSDLATHYHPGGAAYCLRQQGARGHGTCWVRPGVDVAFCLKSPVTPLPPATRIQLPQADSGAMGGGRRVRWRVHACLNGYDAAARADNRACGDGTANRMTSDGPPRRVP